MSLIEIQSVAKTFFGAAEEVTRAEDYGVRVLSTSEDELGRLVIGQEDAVTAISKSIRRNRAGSVRQFLSDGGLYDDRRGCGRLCGDGG